MTARSPPSSAVTSAATAIGLIATLSTFGPAPVTWAMTISFGPSSSSSWMLKFCQSVNEAPLTTIVSLWPPVLISTGRLELDAIRNTSS